jgi:hypothetical protein
MSSLLEQIARRRRASAARRLGPQALRSQPAPSAAQERQEEREGRGEQEGQERQEEREGRREQEEQEGREEQQRWEDGLPASAEGDRIVWRRQEPTEVGGPAWPAAEPEAGSAASLEVAGPPPDQMAQAEPESESESEPEPEPAAEEESEPALWGPEDEALASAVRTVDHGWGPVKLSRRRGGFEEHRDAAGEPSPEPVPGRVEPPAEAAVAEPGQAEETQPFEPGAAPGYLQRGRIRRRARYLRHLREIQLRDIGGFMVELHRFAQERPELVRMKVEGAARTDAELRILQHALGERSPIRELREAGIGGACASCGAVHGSEDNFCAACGERLVEPESDREQIPARR